MLEALRAAVGEVDIRVYLTMQWEISKTFDLSDGVGWSNSVQFFDDDIADLIDALDDQDGEDVVYIPYCAPRFVSYTSADVIELMTNVFPEDGGGLALSASCNLRIYKEDGKSVWYIQMADTYVNAEDEDEEYLSTNPF